jgi:hypothetical protein
MPFDLTKPVEHSPLDAGEVRDQLNALKALIDASAPVGCMKAWLKSFPGVPALPSGWVECNGQVLSDAQSPLNGQTLPDLNGAGGTQRFLRGATASGGTGGSDTMNLGGEIPVDCNLDASVTSAASAPQPDLSIVPSYYEVVWVMKVK